MIAHESKYGQTILISSELYVILTDEQLENIEERCMDIDSEIVTYSKGVPSKEDS